MIHKIELLVDTLDFQAIQESMSRRQSWRVLPDADEPDANLSGRLVAEICRGWMDALDDRRDPEDEEGEEWKREVGDE